MNYQEIFKALADPVRRDILFLLRDDRKTAGDIAARFDLSAATMSYHLSILKKANLIYESRFKNYIYYSLNLSVVEEVMLWLSTLNPPQAADDGYSYIKRNKNAENSKPDENLPRREEGS